MRLMLTRWHPQCASLKSTLRLSSTVYELDFRQLIEFEPGFIWTLKVSLHEYSGEWANAELYEYELIKVLDKEEASVDEKSQRIPEAYL